MIKGKSAQEIRELFNIVNDFTPEEEVSCACVFATCRVLLTQCLVFCVAVGAAEEGERECPPSGVLRGL